MIPRWKKATYATIAGLGLFAGAAGIAAAATGTSTPSPAASASANVDTPEPGDTPDAAGSATDEADQGTEVDGADCVDGIDAATGAECDGGPAANPANDPNEAGDHEGDESDGEQADDQSAYTSSVTVADNGGEQDDATEAANLQQLATITADQASLAAVAAVPGTVQKVELDNENGSVVYSVEIQTTGGQIDVKVDAGNGKVLAQEAGDGEPDHADGDESGAEQNDN